MIDKIKQRNFKKLIVIGTKRSNDEVLETIRRELKDVEIIYYDDYLFLPNIKQSNWNLPEHIMERVVALKELDADAILVTSTRFNHKLVKRINDLTDLEVIYDKPLIYDGPIVVIDSGVGGLSVASKIHELFPTEDINVIVDNKNMPLGSKDVRIISRRSTQLIKYVKTLNPKLVVLACNTIDAVAGDKIAAQLGGIKLIDIISETTKVAAEVTKGNEIALIATPNTIESQQYMMKLLMHTSNKHLIGLSCEELASTIEHGGDVKSVFNEEIEPLEDFDFETLILGCTHFTKIKPLAIKKFKDINIVDSVDVVVESASNYIKENKLEHNTNQGSLTVNITLDNDEIKENINKNFKDEEHEIKLLEI